MIFVQNHAIERLAQQLALSHQVAVAPVAGRRVDDRTALLRKLLNRLDQRAQRRHVVTVVDDHGRAGNLQQIEATGNFLQIACKGLHARADRVARNAQRPGRRGRGQRVFHLERNTTAVRQRHVFQRDQRDFDVPFGHDDHSVPHENRTAASATMDRDHRIVSPHREEDHRRLQYGAMAATCGSLAFSTAAPSLATASTIARLTTANCSIVSMSDSPRWSPSPMFVTTATSQRSKPSPARRIPPRAVSSTATSTAGFISTACGAHAGRCNHRTRCAACR